VDVDSELTIRNTSKALFFAFLGLFLGVGDIVTGPSSVIVASVGCLAVAGLVFRQKVSIQEDGLVLVGLVRRRLLWSEIDGMDVYFMPVRGWSLRLWRGEQYVETMSCWAFFNEGFVGATFPSPPEEAPGRIYRMYYAIAGRLPSPRRPTTP